MPHKLILLFVFVFSITAQSQSLEWEDLSVFKINTTAPHAHFELFASQTQKKNGNQSSLEKSLNGMWDFKWYTTPEKAPTNFSPMILIVHSGVKFRFLPIGSSTQNDFPLYSNIVYPYEINPPFMPKDYNPSGVLCSDVYDSRKLG